MRQVTFLGFLLATSICANVNRIPHVNCIAGNGRSFYDITRIITKGNAQNRGNSFEFKDNDDVYNVMFCVNILKADSECTNDTARVYETKFPSNTCHALIKGDELKTEWSESSTISNNLIRKRRQSIDNLCHGKHCSAQE